MFDRPRRQGRTILWIILAIVIVGVVGIARTMRAGPGDLSPGPFGSGGDRDPAAMVAGASPVARTVCPDTHPVKGNINPQGQWIYHPPGGEFYPQTNPERCFATEAEAWRAGFRPARR
jgi:hypothetical protein